MGRVAPFGFTEDGSYHCGGIIDKAGGYPVGFAFGAGSGASLAFEAKSSSSVCITDARS